MVQPDIRLFTERDYVAPTVYTLPTRYISTWNYYSSLAAAVNKYKYLHKLGGYDVTPVGWTDFANNQKAITFGINCDFYVLKDDQFQLSSYKYLKYLGPDNLPPVIFRFLLPSGAGPFYAILDPYYFGLSAQSIASVSADKLAALDDLYRAVDVLKFRYNALVGFLNDMGKRQLNSVEQQIFNEGMLILNSFNQQIATIKGIEVSYSQTGAIGLPIILIIIVIAILATATAWTIATIVTEKEKTKQIADSYDMNRWIVDKKKEIAGMVEGGSISQTSANSIYKTLDGAAAVANSVAQKAAENTKGLLDNISDIVKWGVLGVVGWALISHLSKPKSNVT